MTGRARGARHTAAGLAILSAAACAVPASAATEIGFLGGAPGDQSCEPGNTVVQAGTGVGKPSYAVPAPGGVITSWRVQTYVGATTLILKVVRATPFTEIFSIVGESAPSGLPAPGVHSFTTRIPAQAGDRIGFHVLAGEFDGCAIIVDPPDPADIVRYSQSGNPPVGGSWMSLPDPLLSERINLAATVEPDADGDGFGDETQDLCPTGASTQSECDPPETSIESHPRKRTAKRKAKFTFASDEPGGTFACKLDHKPVAPCTSPFRKRVSPGRHQFRVQAADAAGNVDESPAAFRWKVLSE